MAWLWGRQYSVRKLQRVSLFSQHSSRSPAGATGDEVWRKKPLGRLVPAGSSSSRPARLEVTVHTEIKSGTQGRSLQRALTSYNSGSSSLSWGTPRRWRCPKAFRTEHTVCCSTRPRSIQGSPAGAGEPRQAGGRVLPVPAVSVCPSCRAAVVCYQAAPAAGVKLGQEWPSLRPQS